MNKPKIVEADVMVAVATIKISNLPGLTEEKESETIAYKRNCLRRRIRVMRLTCKCWWTSLQYILFFRDSSSDAISLVQLCCPLVLQYASNELLKLLTL